MVPNLALFPCECSKYFKHTTANDLVILTIIEAVEEAEKFNTLFDRL